jgi:hypothetical protein
MQRMTLKGLMMLALCTGMLASCGGGASDNGQPLPPTRAIVKIRTVGTLDQGVKLGGVYVTGELPKGVSVMATADAYNPSILVTDKGVVSPSGVTGTNAAAFATYDEADRQIIIQVYDQDGFNTGEFVTVNCRLAAGSTVTADNFSFKVFAPVDLNGAAIDTLVPKYSVVLQ